MSPTGSNNSADHATHSGVCPAARALLDRYSEAIVESLALQEAQFHAVVAGDPESFRFDLLIHEANERKHNAKYAYLSHLHTHGCAYVSLRPSELGAKVAGR